MSNFAHREKFATAQGWRPVSVPTHRYRIRELSEADTEWLVCEVYGLLPEWWHNHGPHGPSINKDLWRLSDQLVSCLEPLKRLDKFERAAIVFRAYQHLRNIGVVELRKDCGYKYIRHPLPADPLAKPSRAPCVRAAASLVEHAQPVDDTHVSVPQQMMRGLLSGALTR